MPPETEVRTHVEESRRLKPWRVVQGVVYLALASILIGKQMPVIWLCLRSASMVSTSAEFVEPPRVSTSAFGTFSRYVMFTPRFTMRYQYEVDGQIYESTRLSERGNYVVRARSHRGPSGPSFSNTKTGVWMKGAHETGRATIYYDPASPSTSVGVRDPFDAWFFVVVFVGLGVVLARAGIRCIRHRHNRGVSVLTIRRTVRRNPGEPGSITRTS